MNEGQFENILEAALLASSKPLSIKDIQSLFDNEDAFYTQKNTIVQAIQSLREKCHGRGIELVEVATGFRYQVRASIHPHIQKLWAEKPGRYSRALLETLALIVYRQPVTRGDIEEVRGVSVSSSIIRTLQERNWIRIIGHQDTPGRPALYGTTQEFLDYFNLESLDQLPPLDELVHNDTDARNPQNPPTANVAQGTA